jgi:hypothetical protein
MALRALSEGRFAVRLESARQCHATKSKFYKWRKSVQYHLDDSRFDLLEVSINENSCTLEVRNPGRGGSVEDLIERALAGDSLPTTDEDALLTSAFADATRNLYSSEPDSSEPEEFPPPGELLAQQKV